MGLPPPIMWQSQSFPYPQNRPTPPQQKQEDVTLSTGDSLYPLSCQRDSLSQDPPKTIPVGVNDPTWIPMSDHGTLPRNVDHSNMYNGLSRPSDGLMFSAFRDEGFSVDLFRMSRMSQESLGEMAMVAPYSRGMQRPSVSVDMSWSVFPKRMGMEPEALPQELMGTSEPKKRNSGLIEEEELQQIHGENTQN